MNETAKKLQASSYKPQGEQPDAGCWMLVSGCWLLVEQPNLRFTIEQLINSGFWLLIYRRVENSYEVDSVPYAKASLWLLAVKNRHLLPQAKGAWVVAA